MNRPIEVADEKKKNQTNLSSACGSRTKNLIGCERYFAKLSIHQQQLPAPLIIRDVLQRRETWIGHDLVHDG